MLTLDRMSLPDYMPGISHYMQSNYMQNILRIHFILAFRQHFSSHSTHPQFSITVSYLCHIRHHLPIFLSENDLPTHFTNYKSLATLLGMLLSNVREVLLYLSSSSLSHSTSHPLPSSRGSLSILLSISIHQLLLATHKNKEINPAAFHSPQLLFLQSFTIQSDKWTTVLIFTFPQYSFPSIAWK